ncbi:MAG: twitching motility protein PilT [Nitrosopumilus sp. H13]|nr:MAG: twitching motility protein PilT [Nitrosopumilus sp. H13]
MARVICDTSFLIHLATRRITNIDGIEMEIGPVTFVVPEVVRNELARLCDDPLKKNDAEATIKHVSGLETVPMNGRFADDGLLEHARMHHSIIGTMDRELKRQVKEAGGSVMSFWNDRIVLES